MTDLVDPESIEAIVGVKRHPHQHWGRAVAEEETFYILHSQHCREVLVDLRDCRYSTALDHTTEHDMWEMEEPTRLGIEYGKLVARP